MPIAKEAKDTLQRFSTYIQELIALCRKHSVTSPKGLWKAVRNSQFRDEWKAIWLRVADADGGKLTLGTVFGIVGAVLGGVGIAAGGGAIGVPMALLLAPIGFLIGGDLDSSGLLKKVKAFFSDIGEAVAETTEADHDLEQIVGMLQELLARADQAEEAMRETSIKATELERVVSELRAKTDQYEAEARQGETRILALETRVAELENTVSQSRFEFAKVTQRMKALNWVALSMAGVALAGTFWLLMR